MLLFVGTFTNGFMNTKPGRGIVTLGCDDATGKLRQLQVTGGLHSPSFLAIHPALPFLYAAEREFSADEPDSGAVAVFRISTAEAAPLSPVQRFASLGDYPSHINLSRAGDRLFVSHARSSELVMFEVAADGQVGAHLATAILRGRGARPRQFTGSWLHSAFADARDKRVLACDLHSDRIIAYRLDGEGLPLAEQPVIQVSSGAGPRHLCFNPAGDMIFVANEFDSSISAFSYDEATGETVIRQTIATIPAGFAGDSALGEILVEPSGRFLYASNRGHNSIVVFRIGSGRTKLELAGYVPSGGAGPRHFAIDPQGRFLAVANQMRGSVASFRLDRETGLPEFRDEIAIDCPACVQIRR